MNFFLGDALLSFSLLFRLSPCIKVFSHPPGKPRISHLAANLVVFNWELFLCFFGSDNFPVWSLSTIFYVLSGLGSYLVIVLAVSMSGTIFVSSRV